LHQENNRETAKGIPNLFSADAAHCFGTVVFIPGCRSVPAESLNAGTNIQRIEMNSKFNNSLNHHK
jgi:hypothetical protein